MRAIAAAIAVAAMSAASTVHAGTTSLSFSSTVIGDFGTLGTYEGSLGFSHTDGSGSATLTVTLKNLVTTAAGGKMTGFVFNGPAVSGLNYALSGVPNTSWKKTSASENAAPFGTYSLGAALAGRFLGGGSPAAGIGIGEEFAFQFTVTGASSLLETLSASSFWNSKDGNPAFLARFRGFANGGSDKSPAELAVQVVPIPAPVLLAGAGFIGAVVLRRRMTRS